MGNFFDPANLFGGGSSATDGTSGGMDATGILALMGNSTDQNQRKRPVVEAPEGYGSGADGGGASGDSQFNRIRKSQLGMGGSST